MISRLHYITQDLPDFTHPQLAEYACKGGADWVQLRIKKKNISHAEWIRIAEETKHICKKYNAKLIINDNVLIAKEVDADGVHLGKEDMNPKEAGKILGSNFMIGGSTNTLEDVQRMINDGCDYIGVGPYRFTPTKEKLNPVLGLGGIKTIADKLGSHIPMIAIGGIGIKDVEPLKQTGIHGLAVSSAINFAKDKIAGTREFIQEIQKHATLQHIKSGSPLKSKRRIT